MKIRILDNNDAQMLSEYYQENEAHFRPWEPRRSLRRLSAEEWERQTEKRIQEQREGSAIYFVTLNSGEGRVIGHCTLSQIVYGPFLACYMGYAVAKDYEGQGVMYKCCKKAIDFAFKDLGLNRIMANYMPHNNRSGKLLRKLGFKVEGKANNYLRINGKWEDHILTALLKPANI